MSIKKAKMGRKPVYEQAIKSAVCFEVLRGRLTYSEARTVYAIKGSGTVAKWVKQYREQFLESNLHGMNPTGPAAQNTNADNQTGNSEALHKKNQELEAALKMATLKITALETMIDIAESELNIDIRKKSGTKQ